MGDAGIAVGVAVGDPEVLVAVGGAMVGVAVDVAVAEAVGVCVAVGEAVVVGVAVAPAGVGVGVSSLTVTVAESVSEAVESPSVALHSAVLMVVWVIVADWVMNALAPGANW